MYKLLPLIVLAYLIALPALPANADERDRFREKLHDRIETLTMWRMMQALDLDNDTSEKILQVRGKFLAQRKVLQKALHQSYADLKNYLKEEQSKENEKKLEETIKSIRKTRQDLRVVWEQQFDEISKVLPIRKQAELVIFMKDFRNEIKAMLRGGGERPHRPPFEGGFHRGPGRGGQMGEDDGPPPGPPGRRMEPPPGPRERNAGARMERPGRPDQPDVSDMLPDD